MSIEKLKEAIEQQKKIETMRLENWGDWGKGGYPSFEPAGWGDIFNGYLLDENQRRSIAELDAMHLEEIISSFDRICRKNTDPKAKGVNKFGTFWKEALLIKYKEQERPLSAMAEEVRKRLKRRCADRTFQHHIQQAHEAIFKWADPI